MQKIWNVIYANNTSINIVYYRRCDKRMSMTQIRLKRIYEDPESTDGYRIFVDRLWPRGMKKEAVHYDVWEKDITPSPELRGWFHQQASGRCRKKDRSFEMLSPDF